MKRSVDLETNIDGDPKGFNTAARSATEYARKLERENARLEKRLKSLGDEMKRSGKSAALMRGEMVTLVAAGAGLAPAFVAAGAGVGAFGALAVPAIMKVVKAQQEMAETWDSMSAEQRTSAAGLRQLIDQYKALASSVEPDVLKTFNAGLSLTGSLLPRLAPLTRAVSRELTDFINESEVALNSRRADEFFAMLESEAPRAVGALGDAVGSGAHLVASLTESLMPLATAGLGVVSMFADLVAAVSDVSPELAQLIVLGVGLRGPIGSLSDVVGKASGRYKEYSGAAKGAGLATKALNVASAAGPNLYLAAGVALGLLAIKAMSAKSSTDKLVDSLTVANRATGNNIQGYYNLSAALGNQVNKQLATQAQRYGEVTKAVQANNGQVNAAAIGNARAAYDAQQSAKKLGEAQREADEHARTAIAGADALAKKYGLTRDEAVRLADAVGVNLSKSILDGGEIAAGTAAKFDRYRTAVEMARDPTAVISQAWKDAANSGLALKERIDAVNSALDAFFNPSIAVYNATTAMDGAFVRASEAIKKSKGSLDTHNATSRAARDAFADAATKVRDTAQAVYTYTSRTKGAEAATVAQRDAVLAQLPELAKLAGKNQDAQAQVAALAYSYGISGRQAAAAGVKVQGLINKINGLHSKNVNIGANTSAAYGALNGLLATIRSSSASVSVGVMGGRSTIGGRASGGYIRGPGSGTSDSIPAMLSNGEYVINARSTSRHRELLEAINAGRYARGGLVRGYADGGLVRGYADGGQVDVPLSDFVSRFMDGKALSKTDYAKVVRARADAVGQLRRAERKLAEDRRTHKSAKTIADDEARVAKERRDLATATERLSAASTRYNRSKLAPSKRLSAALDLGIKNTKAFVANLEKIAARGYPELAQALLAMGGPQAESYARDAAKLTGGKLAALNKKVQSAARYQAKLEALPDVLAIKAARKSGAKNLPQALARTGLSEEQASAAYTAMGYARGGYITGPGSGTSDSIPARVSRGEYIVNSRATAQYRQLLDTINTGRVTAGSAGAGGGALRITLDTRGAYDDMLRMVRKMVRVEGRGNVQLAFGKTG